MDVYVPRFLRRMIWISFIVSLSVLATRSASAAQNDKTFSTEASNRGHNGERFRFEIVSIRPLPGLPGSMTFLPSPNGFTSGLNFYNLLDLAYAPSGSGITQTVYWRSYRISNEPSWFANYYQIDARVSQSDLTAWQSQGADHELLRSALRTMLKDRCKLVAHEQGFKGQVYELTVGKQGPRLTPTPPKAVLPIGIGLRSGGVIVSKTVNRRLAMEWHGATMRDLAEYLSATRRLAFPVRDMTGLAGRYDFTLREVEILPDDDPLSRFPVDNLGLRVKLTSEIIPGLVIDHIEKPTPN